MEDKRRLSPASGGGTSRLLSLEVGRFLAAALVMCFHYSLTFLHLRDDPIFDMIFAPARAGVEYFFVLSGFIIFYIHQKDLGKPQLLRDFALKRVIRIYPVYWMIFVCMFLVLSMSSGIGHGQELFSLSRLADALLLPNSDKSIVASSWSLQHEMVFYAIFALCVVNARLGLVCLVGWQAACLIIGILYPDDMPLILKPFLYIYNVGFGLGILTAWATKALPPRYPRAIAAVGVIGFFTCMGVEWRLTTTVGENTQPLGLVLGTMLYLLFSALIIFGLTQFEKIKSLPFAPLLKVLGGCSYALYLIHGPAGSVIIRIFALGPLKAIPNPVVFVIMVVATIVGAIIVHLYIEKPVMRWLRHRLLARKSAEPPVAVPRTV